MSRHDARRQGSSSSMVSLDVLAHVATATLEETSETGGYVVEEPQGDVEYVIEGGQDLSEEILQGIQSLTLEAIHALSIKSLVMLFSNLYYDKSRQHFTASCAFMPEKCQQEYLSYGSESRAITSMQRHIAHHLYQLLQEAERDPSLRTRYFPTVNHEDTNEVAISLNELGRNPAVEVKNEVEDWRYNKTASPSPPVSPQVIPPQPTLDNELVFGIRVNDDEQAAAEATTEVVEEEETYEEEGLIHFEDDQHLESGDRHFESGDRHFESEEDVEVMDFDPRSIVLDSDVALGGAEVEVETAEATFTIRQGVDQSLYGQEEDIKEEEEDSDLSRFTHDHAYTFSRPPQETKPPKQSIRGKTKPAGQRAIGAKQFIQATDSSSGNLVFLPVVDGQIVLDNVENKTYVIDEEAEVLTAIEGQQEEVSMPNRRPDYPPMPHANYGTVKLHIQEEWEPTTAEEERVIEEDQRAILGLDPSGSEEETRSEEWIKRTALKHIRYLRGRKKKDNYVLSCRICNDGKVFTAAATLLYHYRSHAGIKAFICQICNTSFTRQHSLNYHMLIHNGQSRFTCDACGRQFRHPQHYKEHLRRHTGETPFACGDCNATFKTRNTFKRHLRTRHEKLLTVDGIRHLSETELRNWKIKEIKREVQRSHTQGLQYKMVDLTAVTEKKS